MGYVSYRGVENDGRHEPLIDLETFEAVQRMLTNHRTSGERSYSRQHYLTGSLSCGRCGSRMGYSVSTGKTGAEYGYFFCLGRHSGRVDCQLRYLPELAVEQAVVDTWQNERPELPIEELQINLLADFEDNAERARQQVEQLKRRTDQVKRERFKWAEKAMDGVVPDDIARANQQQLAAELAKIETDSAQLRRLGDMQREALEAGLRLVADCGLAYGEGNDLLRRAYNQAWFKTISVDEDEGQPIRVVAVEREDVFEALHSAEIKKINKVNVQVGTQNAQPFGSP